MRITVIRTGGIAGQRTAWVIDIDDSADPELRKLVNDVPWSAARASAPQPDRYAYTIEWERRSVTLGEQDLTSDVQTLVNRVRHEGIRQSGGR